MSKTKKLLPIKGWRRGYQNGATNINSTQMYSFENTVYSIKLYAPMTISKTVTLRSYFSQFLIKVCLSQLTSTLKFHNPQDYCKQRLSLHDSVQAFWFLVSVHGVFSDDVVKVCFSVSAVGEPEYSALLLQLWRNRFFFKPNSHRSHKEAFTAELP